MEVYFNKMPNLRSLVFDGVPESFDWFSVMHQLENVTWHVQELKIEEWNRFVCAVRPSLRKLYIESIYFEVILSSAEALPLQSVTTFYLESIEEEYLRFNPKERLMPQLKHYHVDLQDVNHMDDFQRVVRYMPSYAQKNGLDTFSTYCYDVVDLRSRCAIYCKGDTVVSVQSSHCAVTDAALSLVCKTC